MITAEQYQEAASILNCEVAVIMAVAAVESAGSGFLKDGRLKILFEPHIFWRELEKVKKLGKVIAGESYQDYRDILYQRQGTRPYGTSTEQWVKVRRAAAIDRECAYKATSWGKFQPLGTYHNECGFESVWGMINSFNQGEYEQLLGFVNMIKFRKLDDELRRKDWNEFALRYNGRNYRMNNYHVKLPAMYNKLKFKK